MNTPGFFTTLSAFLHERWAELLLQTWEHLELSLLALLIAVGSAVPVGILAARKPGFRKGALGFASALQTVPSLALLGLLIPLLGIGWPPAVFALYLYALLPIVQNTTTGILGLDATVITAANALGFTRRQVLFQVELPLALPVIFAGVRTATVITVGIATLTALVGAGGLGVYIFRGISLNNNVMILAGAVPAALLALFLDGLLAQFQTAFEKPKRAILPGILLGTVLLTGGGYRLHTALGSSTPAEQLRVGVNPEFMERPDGYPALVAHYGLCLTPVEMEHGLLYKALENGEVDLVIGYSTDGQIAEYSLEILEDDRRFFPPYEAAPLVRQALLQQHPALRAVLNRLAGQLNAAAMAGLNAKVEAQKLSAEAVARNYLASQGLPTAVRRRSPNADVRIGSKTFAESYILAELYGVLIENLTSLSVEVVHGLGGTQLAFEALRRGEIALYPEYTGTALLAILKPDTATLAQLAYRPKAVYAWVNEAFKAEGLQFLAPHGFNNTYAVAGKPEMFRRLGVRTLSRLARLSCKVLPIAPAKAQGSAKSSVSGNNF